MKRSSCVAVLCVLVSSSAAHAGAGVRLGAGAAWAVTQPQRSYYGIGGSFDAALLWQVAPVFDVGAQLGYALLSGAAGQPSGLSGPASALSLLASVRLKRPLADARLIPWLELSGGYVATGQLSRLGLQAAAGLGLRFDARSPFLFGPMLRYAHVFSAPEVGFTSHDAGLLAVGLSVELLFGFDEPKALDADADGLGDEVDKCPTVAGPLVTHGCPDDDADRDGVMASVDRCPDVAGPASHFGCPDPDPDHDGLAAPADKCPDQAEDRDGFEDGDGCPEPDNDADGLPDGEDACPQLAGPKAAGGCPDQDGDGVADRVDPCPTVAGAREDGGCPRYERIVVTEQKIELRQKIFFAFGKTTILPKSYPLLDEVMRALNDRGSICVRIEGHTDNVGNEKKNLTLSQGRADAVRKYLVDHQVSAGRLVAKGYGSSLPLETNATVDGREANRRVEFIIVPCAGATP